MADRLPPPPFWQTPYFEYEVKARPDQTMSIEPVIRYYPDSDTMAIEVRPWPADAPRSNAIGGEDTGEDLVIHYAADGEPWLWEIEHASAHPEHIVAALEQIRLRAKLAA